eukprot:7256284-Heterocapsa_arctica.AAC.1
MACAPERLAFLRLQPAPPRPSSRSGTPSQRVAGTAPAIRHIPDAFQLEGSTETAAGNPQPRRVVKIV